MKLLPQMTVLTILCALLLVLTATYAPAENASTDPDVQVNLSSEMKKKEKAFKNIRKKLSKKQDELITELEQIFMTTLDPEIQVIKLQNNMAACEFEEEAERTEAEEKLSAFREWTKKKQVILWGTFEQEQMPRVDFMDHAILRQHLALKLHIAKSTASQLIRLQSTRSDIQTRCQQAKNTLDGITLVSNKEEKTANQLEEQPEKEQEKAEEKVEEKVEVEEDSTQKTVRKKVIKRRNKKE